MGYKIFDAHADTMSKLYESGENFLKNTCHIDFDRMKKYDGYTQVFAAFVDKKATSEKPNLYIKKVIERYKKEVFKSDVCHCETFNQLNNSKFSSILSIEGGEALDGSIDNLYEFYQLGVRIMTLTWNYRNEICDGIGEGDGKGLTAFGKTVVQQMNKLGMVIDVSHISQKGFWDVLNCSQKPFIASHSCVMKLCNHPRNLTDEQIKAIIEADGVIGVNFYPLFLDESGKCKMEKILEHIEYIIELGGENNIGIGSDFDGIEYLPDGMTGIENIGLLISLMEERKYGEKIINKILFENFLRVLKAVFT